ncbi:MAG: Gfo/Idh/MocA family oxidoreductase [Armatimonadetes bacterium]|nr:Gfo/Idh/MocA family oxidoreductase [Armatimonadota bacterium]
MTNKPLKVGIVGCGAIFSTHADALKEISGADLFGACDIVPERAQTMAEKYGVRPFSKLSQMLPHVDMVTVAVPSGLHAQLATQAVKAGKITLVEKPIDVNLRKAEALVQLAKDKKVPLGVISQHRFAKDIQRVREAIQSGELGKLYQADVVVKWLRTQAYYDSGEWRGTHKLDGGCLMNQTVHYIDMLQWITGGVKAVQAMMKTAAHDMEAEDIAYALVEFKNGALGLIHGSTCCYPGFSERIEVHGAHGSVMLEGDTIRLWSIDPASVGNGKYGNGVNAQPTPNHSMHELAAGNPTGASDPTAIWGEQHKLQIQDFVDSVHSGKRPFIAGEDALEPLKIIRAIYKSASKKGRRIEVNP